MYKTRKKIVTICVYTLAVIFFIGFALFLIPEKNTENPSIYSLLIVGVFFCAIIFLAVRLKTMLVAKVYHDTLEKGETVIIKKFIDSLRFCYTLDDFYVAIGDYLERRGDCSVLLIDRVKNYTLYNSPNRITSSDSIREKMCQNFSENWKDGFYYFDRHFGVTSRLKKSRGFFLCSEKQHMFVFCTYTRLFDQSIYEQLFE